MNNLTAEHDKVGFFDSGIGGMSVAREFLKLRPNADVFYIADWDFCPYGDKDHEIVLERAHTLTRKLLEKGCKLIVVACNTATAVAIDSLRATYDVPFVGMEPAVKPAALHSKSRVIGIIATANTLQGRLFRETSARFAANAKIIPAVGEGFVELVENGEQNTDRARAVVSKSSSRSSRKAPTILCWTHPLLVLERADCEIAGCRHHRRSCHPSRAPCRLADLARELKVPVPLPPCGFM